MEYLTDHKDHYKWFIEDDQTIEEYIKEMSQSSVWGGNIELSALANTFCVKIYIHIYNSPTYLVEPEEDHKRTVQLSYHDGSHYNSVRLETDGEGEAAEEVTAEFLAKIKTGGQLPNEDDDDEDEEDPVKEEEEGLKEFCGLKIGDLKLKNKEEDYKSVIFSGKHRKIVKFVDRNKKCPCSSKKKYKNCCFGIDIPGEYDEKNNEFYCDISEFNKKVHGIEEEELESLEKQMSAISI